MGINATKEDEQTNSVKKTTTLLRLYSYLFKYTKEIVFVLFIMLVVTAIYLYNPMLIEIAIDKYISDKDFIGLVKLIIFALIINIIAVLLTKLRMKILAKMCNKIVFNIRKDLYTHIQTLDFHFFDSRPTGKILSRIMGDTNSLKDILSDSVSSLIPNFITVIAVVIIMIIKSPKLTLASLSSLPLLLIGMIFIETASHKKWQIFRKKSSNLNAFVHEDFEGINVIKSFDAENEAKDDFKVLVDEHESAFLGAAKIVDTYFPVIDTSWAIGMVMLYYVGLKIIGAENISIGLMLAFGTYLSMFWQPISSLASFYNQLITNIAAAERIFEVLDTPSEVIDNDGSTDFNQIKGKVEFKDVTFAYSDAPNVNVIENVNFVANPGETIALVGPTGAGKTTIISLISRFYNATKGKVLIDDIDVSEITLHSLRSQLGIMTQENFLFTGTVKENIKYGRLNATDEEVIEAAKAVGAHDFIMKMEKGYDTELSERGGGLSIGQKQLLAFARAFVSKPKILILDEATSSIDTKTEILVQNGIKSLLANRTSFVIAHRLSTIQNADKILVINDKGIVESGTAKELMEIKGEYYKLYMAQFTI